MANGPLAVPLQSLLFFESAVRHLNFTLVADELGTSQPAVSQRIAALEKDLGTLLFLRAHRGVTVTADGAALHEAVREHLAALQWAMDRLRARRTRRVVTLATDFAFAHFWLMPRLGVFQQLRPELDVRIVTSQQPFDVRGEAVDMAIAFGSGAWPGCDARRLWPELVLPVCTPALAARHAVAGGSCGAVFELPLLHLDGSARNCWMTWREWGRRQGCSGDGALAGNTLGNYPLLIQAALAGHGVALGWRPLVDQLLLSGQLVSLPTPALTTEHGYYLVRPRRHDACAAVDSLCDWVEQADTMPARNSQQAAAR